MKLEDMSFTDFLMAECDMREKQRKEYTRKVNRSLAYQEYKQNTRYNIQHNLRKLREQKALTQLEVGKMVGKTATAVASWEQGLSLPDITTLCFLAKFYHAKIESIVETKM